ncbi:fused tRNA nucleotidyltransferase/2',3'-cyclic phosphodiesterase/2' nucleotidase/phosphatase Cca, partial [Escherichia coli]
VMREMTHAGELEHLTPERVWKETESALTTRNPQVFFQVLRDCGALRVLFPEIDALFGVPAPARWHPEIDTGIHTLMTLSMAAMLSPQVDVRFATLCHDLGKGLTPPELWPRHHGHGPAGVKLVEQLCQRLRVPNEIRDLARLVAEFHDLIHTFPMLNPKTIVKLFDSIDAWRKPQRVEQLALTSEADVRGRTGFESADYPQGRWLREAWEVAQSVPTKAVVEAGFKGVEIREELTRRRIAAVASWKEQRCPKPE